jgi:uncharacterized repeat protein (TIGR01451 family)
LSKVNKSYALDSIGIGIRKDGQLRAAIGETIEYQVTIFNLGVYRVENITVTDRLPNGASRLWPIPYLAPQGLPGDSLNISHISYTVDQNDLVLSNPDSPYVVNHAEVVGYASVQGVGLLVRAETNFPTFITMIPVGGYTVDVKIVGAQNPITVQLFLLSLVLVFFQTFRWLNRYQLEQSIANWRRNRKSVSRRSERPL